MSRGEPRSQSGGMTQPVGAEFIVILNDRKLREAYVRQAASASRPSDKPRHNSIQAAMLLVIDGLRAIHQALATRSILTIRRSRSSALIPESLEHSKVR